MKFMVVFLFILLHQMTAEAQTPNSNASVRLATTVFLDEVFGKPFNPSVNSDISGSPFINNNWKYSTIKLTDGRYFENVPIRLNIFNQTVHYLSASGKELVADDGIISEIRLTDTAVNGDLSMHTYRNGFNPVDNNNRNTFYEIIVTGNSQLLLCRKVKLAETETLGTNEPVRQFVPYQEYYVCAGENIIKCKRNSSFFLNLFADKKDAVNKYIEQQHLKFKSEKDLKLVVDYYNSL
jgi:hypothetical protein